MSPVDIASFILNDYVDSMKLDQKKLPIPMQVEKVLIDILGKVESEFENGHSFNPCLVSVIYL